MIQELSKEYPIEQLCLVLQVARSGYYRWAKGEMTARDLVNKQLAEQIRNIHQASRGAYGSPRITQALRRVGHKCNHKRVARLMRQHGLKGRMGKRRKVKTTNSEHDQPITPNLLRGRPAPTKPDEVWVADIHLYSNSREMAVPGSSHGSVQSANHWLVTVADFGGWRPASSSESGPGQTALSTRKIEDRGQNKVSAPLIHVLVVEKLCSDPNHSSFRLPAGAFTSEATRWSANFALYTLHTGGFLQNTVLA